jgi:hypothetical protein
MVFTLKPGKNPMLPSSYKSVSLLDTVGERLERILVTRVLWKVNMRGLLRDEQFRFRPRHSTTLQLSRLLERVNGSFDDKQLNGASFLNVAKAFDAVFVGGLLCIFPP